jgi:hypothetical protein
MSARACASKAKSFPASGEIYLDRTTLTPLEDGRVRQLIEISTDGGHSWRSIFDGYYSRRE